MSGNKKDAETRTDKDRANHLEEWKIARDAMQFFDEQLHDLRKYGFGLVTALTAAEGIVIGKLSASVDPPVKFAVFAVTLLLILAVHLIDQNYRVSQQVINMRAVILETKLNLELSETITDRYQRGDIEVRLKLLYVFFISSVVILGGFTLYPHWIYIAILGGAAIVATILTFRLRPSPKHGLGDWTISPLECTPEDKVTVTLTNLSELFGRKHEPIHFDIGEVIWHMINEETGAEILPKKKATRTYDIIDRQTWTLTTDDFPENGTYKLSPEGWGPHTLHRRIIVSGKALRETKEKGLSQQ